MKTALFAFLKKPVMPLLMVGGLGAYFLISKTTGSCGACVAIDLPPLIQGAQAPEPASATEKVAAP